MKRNIGRYAATAVAGMGLLTYLLLTSALGQGSNGPVSLAETQNLISGWPQTSKMAAGVMLEEYGQPNTVSAGSLVWFGHGAWKRTVVYRDGWQDQASVVHPEVLEQAITYRVPQDSLSELAGFDSRLGIDNAKHELSFRSDSEKMNILAMNLADEIAARRKTPEQARAYALKAVKLSEEGKDTPYTKSFMFPVQNEFEDIPR